MSARGSNTFGVQLGDVAFCTRVHSFQSGVFSCLAFETGDEIKEVEAIAKVSVTFLADQAASTALRIKSDMTFDVYFRSNYPETPPVVHVARSGGCDESLLDNYDDPRIDYDKRGTLYTLRICDPADGWFPSYNFSCVVFALRWTISHTLNGNLAKPTDISRLGVCFEMKDLEENIPDRNASLGPVRCWSLHHEEQGYRESMEDVILALDDFPLGTRINKEQIRLYAGARGAKAPSSKVSASAKRDESLRFYAVFDGHGGEYAAHYAGKHLPKHLRDRLSQDVSVREALWDSCRRTDDELYAEIDKQFVPDSSGTTMCCVVIDDSGMLHCANVGDSRAVLCRDGKAVPLSSDQKADDPNEIGRIVECGGFVTDARVMGDLAVARALGDYDFKPQEQCVITADPDIFSMQLDSVADEFIVVACDGLWDVMSSAAVVKYCRDWLYNNPFPPNDGSNLEGTLQTHHYHRLLAELVEHAVEDLGSSDNVSVILVLLGDPAEDSTALNVRRHSRIGQQEANKLGRGDAIRAERSSQMGAGNGNHVSNDASTTEQSRAKKTSAQRFGRQAEKDARVTIVHRKQKSRSARPLHRPHEVSAHASPVVLSSDTMDKKGSLQDAIPSRANVSASIAASLMPSPDLPEDRSNVPSVPESLPTNFPEILPLSLPGASSPVQISSDSQHLAVTTKRSFHVRKKSMAAQRYGSAYEGGGERRRQGAKKRSVGSDQERTFRHKSISRRNKSLDFGNSGDPGKSRKKMQVASAAVKSRFPSQFSDTRQGGHGGANKAGVGVAVKEKCSTSTAKRETQSPANETNSFAQRDTDFRPKPHSMAIHARRIIRAGSDLSESETTSILAAFDKCYASGAATSATHFSDWHEIHVRGDRDRLAYVNAVTREARWTKPSGWVRMMTQSLKGAKRKDNTESKPANSRATAADRLRLRKSPYIAPSHRRGESSLESRRRRLTSTKTPLKTTESGSLHVDHAALSGLESQGVDRRETPSEEKHLSKQDGKGNSHGFAGRADVIELLETDSEHYYYTLQLADPDAEESVRGPLSLEDMAKTLVLLRASNKIQLRIRQGTKKSFSTLDRFPLLQARMKSALTALQDFSESSGEDSSASSDDSAPGLDESIITPGDIRVNPETPLQSQNSISYDFWYLQTSDGQIIGPHPQSHVSSWYKNGDLDPSVLLSPAMRIHGTNQWVTDPLTLQFQAIDVYRMYMGAADDENKTSKTDDQWYYEGDNGNIFGPFSLTQMRAWYSGGHLPHSLHVRRGSTGNLFPLADVAETFEKKEICNEWLYMSETGPQGPFTHAQMAVWLQHGYLEGDLQVARGETEQWKALHNFIGEGKDFQREELS